MGFFNKQSLRDKMSKSASYVEIYLGFMILIGILFLSVRVIGDVKQLVENLVMGKELMNATTFLAHIFELIIGIEFVKMLAKHTPSSTVDVILYAIARKLIVNHDSMLDSLIGVLAIAILFGVRKYLSESIHKSNDHQYIVNAGTTVDEISKKADIKIDSAHGNTAAGIIYNIAKLNNEEIKTGYIVNIGNILLEVYSMDSSLIKQVRILKK